ncbi:hypothetical protein OO013_09620 [Mangrovivirga sp. M17]|uniref:Transglutaminase-like domain-containing protein n=1 Tax=Mangrovivirga halotolerans TaxID=2993936 RepID=A0ABT3RQQ6_9BACT|nr:transglutaminase domain-containing protein [Mangrovivirga halotolerans]MCX2744124.1 hypothetical protein [Mangrovivirga halotolerans]
MIRLILFLSLLVYGYSIHAQQADFKHLDFNRADSIAKVYEGEGLDNLPLLVYHLTSPLQNQAEKFRAIYTWVTHNVANDYNYFLKNKRKREKFADNPERLAEWNDEFRFKVIRKLQKEQETICTGYAYLISELAGLADIDSRVINGYGRTVGSNVGGSGIPNHSWNAVKLDGKWYLCDATWSSRSINAIDKEFIKEYNDGYFLADPELFALNHYPLDTTWLLTDSQFSLESFLNGPLVYKNAFSKGIYPIAPNLFENNIDKGEELTITIEIFKDIDPINFSFELGRGSYRLKVDPLIFKKEDGIYDLKIEFDNKEKYDVHLKIGNEYIATYVVMVN